MNCKISFSSKQNDNLINFFIRLIEIESKEAVAALQIIHISLTEVTGACVKARKIFENCSQYYKQLAAIVPKGEYYRFSDHWNYTTQRIVSSIALVVYLEAGFLVTRDTCAEILGLSTIDDAFHLDLETYLMGILSMTNELSRFATNSVTLGDYDRVTSLQNFIGNINSGYR
jgi:predicted translin family RNA/ssDNA-binding protein